MNSFELQPHLVGDLVEARPLKPEDWKGLFAAAADQLIWQQHPAHDRYKEDVFREFFQGALDSGGAFIVLDRKTGEVIGSSRYFGLDLVRSEIEIGWTFLIRSHWGSKYNRELKKLMLDHAFKFVDNVIFLIGATNIRSRKAIEKIGGILTERREQRTLNGETIEHVVYKISKPAWMTAVSGA
jgi:RimJ/RimL family protein N-acetyltransferase